MGQSTKSNLKKITSVSAMKFTQDDWYPAFRLDGSYKGNEDNWLVEVSWIKWEDTKTSRVCVWGADDMGLELDFGPRKYDESQALFLNILAQKYVNQGFLKKLGFVPA